MAGHVAQARGVGAVAGGIARGGAGHEAEVGPERTVRVERHLVVAVTDLRRHVFDLRPVHREVDPVGGGELAGIDAVESLQDTIEVGEPPRLCRRADVGQRGRGLARAVVAVLVPAGRLLAAPVPLGLVDRLEGLVSDVRWCLCVHKCGQQQAASKEEGFHVAAPGIEGKGARADLAPSTSGKFDQACRKTPPWPFSASRRTANARRGRGASRGA